MIVDFADDDLKELIEYGKNNKYKRLSKDKGFCTALVSVYNRLLSVENANELKQFSSLHYEKLKYDRSGQSSVRIQNGRVERLIFEEFDGGIKIVLLELNESHYGRKK
ncbi:MAG: hypothetical protein K5846_09050 [Bacteroidales bacterium]|nr:hypothetical protein [Bacteroidales bacterium]